eukprot:1158796-Pelagomonas_calceolata.AAC.4
MSHSTEKCTKGEYAHLAACYSPAFVLASRLAGQRRVNAIMWCLIVQQTSITSYMHMLSESACQGGRGIKQAHSSPWCLKHTKLQALTHDMPTRTHLLMNIALTGKQEPHANSKGCAKSSLKGRNLGLILLFAKRNMEVCTFVAMAHTEPERAHRTRTGANDTGAYSTMHSLPLSKCIYLCCADCTHFR